MRDKWTKRASRPQPYTNLTLTNEREYYIALGHDFLKRTRAVSLPIMADTGCERDRHWSHPTNGPEYQGLHTSMTIKSAKNKGIRILGDVVIRFAGNRGTCMDLGMISDKFPTLGEVNLATSEFCDCPRRAEPPAKPTTLSMSATEANRAALQINTY